MGREVRVLTEADLREAVPLDLAAVEVVERAFAALASGAVVMPPIMSMAIPGGHDEVDGSSCSSKWQKVRIFPVHSGCSEWPKILDPTFVRTAANG